MSLLQQNVRGGREGMAEGWVAEEWGLLWFRRVSAARPCCACSMCDKLRGMKGAGYMSD